MPGMGGGMMGMPAQTASPVGQITEPAGGAKSMQYFMDMAEAEKHIKGCVAEVKFNNSAGAIGFIMKAVALFQKHCGPSGKAVHLAPYQAKPGMQVNAVQKSADNKQCEKLCKYAVSEVDFNEIDNAIKWLAHAHQNLMKY